MWSLKTHSIVQTNDQRQQNLAYEREGVREEGKVEREEENHFNI